MDNSGEEMVTPVQPHVHWEQEAHKDLIEEDDHSLYQVEAVSGEG